MHARLLTWRRGGLAAIGFAALLLVLAPVAGLKGGDDDDDGLKGAKALSKAFSQVAKKAMPAVVYIQVEQTVEGGGSGLFGRGEPGEPGESFDPFSDEFFNRFFRHGLPRGRSPRSFRQQGQGSGFLISGDGYILTNHHVVGTADRIVVQLKDGREFKAKVVGSDSRTEVAVIKIDGKDFPSIPLGDSDKIDVGEWAIAVGNPFGLTQTLTVGVVSAKGRDRMGIADYEDFIQTDAAINPGNSGGPLLNLDGQAVGINTAIYSRTGGNMGIGFAIPINMAARIKDQLVKNGKVVRGYLGVVIQDLTEDLADRLGAKEAAGALISDVSPGSPAGKAGLEPEDIVVKLDGKKVKDSSALRNGIAAAAPGDKVRLGILRGGKEIEVAVAVGEMPEKNGGRGPSSPAEKGPADQEKYGLEVQDLSEDLAEEFGYGGDEKGVLVSSVERGGAADRAGIGPGDLIVSVNREEVDSVKDFRKALKEGGGKKPPLLLVKNKKGSRFVTLKGD